MSKSRRTDTAGTEAAGPATTTGPATSSGPATTSGAAATTEAAATAGSAVAAGPTATTKPTVLEPRGLLVVLVPLMLVLFIATLDQTIVATAIPGIGRPCTT